MVKEDLQQPGPTVAEDSKSEEVEVSLSFHWVPPDVRIALRHQHLAALQATASQVAHNLEARQ